MKSVLGILGGMGPMATVDLFQKIIEHTDAAQDQDHIHILIDNNTRIPDRTQAIAQGSSAPLLEMQCSANRLTQAGAQLLLIPCNTAHYFYEELAASTSVPILNMLEESAKELARRGVQRVGLLATDGTIQSRLYHTYLRRYGVEPVVPSPEHQKIVMALVYDGIKSGNGEFDITPFYGVLSELRELGAECLLLGCTELPLAFAQYHLPGPYIDPTDVLAHAAVQAAGYPLKGEISSL